MQRLLFVVFAAGVLSGTGVRAQAAGNEWNRLDADEPAPLFTLTNQDGKRVGLADLRGKTVVLTFLYTECKDVCPALPQILARVDRLLPQTERAQMRFVGVSIDPRRDTPQRLREFMAAHQLHSSRWTLLTGSVEELTRVATDYGVVARPGPRGDLVHNAVFVVIDPAGRLRVEFHGLFTPTEEIARAVRAMIAAAPGTAVAGRR
jgi:protein SCO1/2